MIKSIHYKVLIESGLFFSTFNHLKITPTHWDHCRDQQPAGADLAQHEPWRLGGLFDLLSDGKSINQSITNPINQFLPVLRPLQTPDAPWQTEFPVGSGRRGGRPTLTRSRSVPPATFWGTPAGSGNGPPMGWPAKGRRRQHIWEWESGVRGKQIIRQMILISIKFSSKSYNWFFILPDPSALAWIQLLKTQTLYLPVSWCNPMDSLSQITKKYDRSGWYQR